LLERRAVDLAAGADGQLVEKDDLVRRLVAASRFGELNELGRSGRSDSGSEGASSECNVSADVLAVDEIVDADHAGAGDGRMLEQRLFDFLRTDVRSVVDDDLLLAAAEPEVLLLVG
jgi:hypothetical protein